MKAMILAAGRGERLRPLTDHLPKPLHEVGGKPLIVHHLEALSAAGLVDIVINLSWLGEQIRERLGDGADYGLRIEYSEEPEALETAGGVRQALPLLGERFIVVNADIYTDYDFSRLYNCDSLAHLVLVPNPAHNANGDFTLTDSIVGNDGAPCYTFSGIAQYRRQFFDHLAPGKRALAPLLRAAAERGQVTGELYDGDWTDIGTAERLAALNRSNNSESD
ncbi:MAG: nucleotidyltransferase family protein [Gammaproteobacteria bacterium]|nr:MAG: nucleotidyltransferase family protein [Gammaproteobacteria bacterium]UCH41120.1 MAG: nucleotidyltransferase family protein [Gammaproteobacteria bacterium]